MEFAMQHAAGQCEVTLSGRFLFSDNQTFKEIITMAEAGEIESISVNLAGVTFMDSAALGMLLLLRDRTDARGIRLVLRQPAGQVCKVFEVSRFHQLFEIEE